MPMTLVELMGRINETRTAGIHCAAELTLSYGLAEQFKGPKEWRPNQPKGVWTLGTGLSLRYRYIEGGELKPFPIFQGPCIRRLLEEMVEFFNSGAMGIHTPPNSYDIFGCYELTEQVELGEIPC